MLDICSNEQTNKEDAKDEFECENLVKIKLIHMRIVFFFFFLIKCEINNSVGHEVTQKHSAGLHLSVFESSFLLLFNLATKQI